MLADGTAVKNSRAKLPGVPHTLCEVCTTSSAGELGMHLQGSDENCIHYRSTSAPQRAIAAESYDLSAGTRQEQSAGQRHAASS